VSMFRRFPALLPLAALAFAAVHLAIEHLAGGVKSHHLLNRSDLPAISNWFGLVTLPLLGFVLGLRVSSHVSEERLAGFPRPILAALVGALLYAACLAASFEAGATNLTPFIFAGLFILALALPVYRAEYVVGFVLGMTFTFGSVLPLLVAAVIAALSFVVRFCGRLLVALGRRGRSLSEEV
jgi:hypothetical protein